MSKETKSYGGTKHMRQTMTQGFRTLSGQSSNNYSLSFLDPTRRKRRGEHEVIISAYIELGRDTNCVISYDEEWTTVSRKHAAISFDNGQATLIHMGLNPTLVNDQPIHSERLLENGDTIRLSQDGPRLRYNAATTQTSSMRFTQRMQLFARQALRPYRNMILGLLAFIIIIGFAGAWIINQMNQTIEGQANEIAAQQDVSSELQIENDSMTARLAKERTERKEAEESMGRQIDKVEREAQALRRSNQRAREATKVPNTSPAQTTATSGRVAEKLIRKFERDIYLIQVTGIRMPEQLFDESFAAYSDRWSGTGFMTDDGRFITARHVFQGWRWEVDCLDERLLIINQTDIRKNLIVTFEASSPKGHKFSFTNEQIRFNDSEDVWVCNGQAKQVDKITKGYSDWAYYPIHNLESEISIRPNLVSKLKVGDKVYVLGFPLGYSLQDIRGGGVKPHFSEATISSDGLVNGMITVTNHSLEHGAAGGAVFVKHNNDFYVIGIVSRSTPAVGRIVPISAIE